MFDEHAEMYDSWFIQNENVLQSEILLVKEALGRPGRTLSVGCGSGLFESILRRDHGIEIAFGVEPADGMARIAEKRGLDVRRAPAESLPFGDAEFDTVLMNGTPGYLSDLGQAMREAHRVLKSGGHLVVSDVPAAGSYGILYQLAARVARWDEPTLAKIAPPHPYPIEFVGLAHWRTTDELTEALEVAGFVNLEYRQTLTRHPKYSNNLVETPVEGFDRGDYVAIRGRKP